jgi:hypothetical protein
MRDLNDLKDRIFGRETNPDKRLIEQITYLMMELNISYRDMMEMPIPAFKYLMGSLGDIRKRENKQMKKK